MGKYDGALYIDGDYEVAPGTHLETGVVVTGVLRLGDGCECDGDVCGDQAVILGEHVKVHGDIFSHGPVLLGPGFELDGKINPPDPYPIDVVKEATDIQAEAGEEIDLEPQFESDPTLEAGSEPAPENEVVFASNTQRPLVQIAIQDTLSLLLEMAWTAHREDRGGYPDTWWGLDWDSATEILVGLLGMVNESYRHGDMDVPWSEDEVFDVLLGQVAPQVLPISMRRTSKTTATLKVGPPTRRFDHTDPTTHGWAWPALAFLNILGYAVHPGFRLSLVGDEEALEPDADPRSVEVSVEVEKMVAGATPAGA